MSLILDALRKSEHQRQRQAGPGLAVVPESGAKHRPATWVLVLGVLLAANVIVLAVMLLTGRPSNPDAVTPQATDAMAPAAAPAAPRAQPPRSVPVTLPPKPPRDEVRPLTTEVTPPPASPAPGAAQGAPPASVDAPRPTATADTERASQDARLPRFTDLVVRGELNVPHMHVDIHVFSPDPAERFVFINMRRYNEGDATQEGPRIERITNDGVVMDYQGQRFFLARD